MRSMSKSSFNAAAFTASEFSRSLRGDAPDRAVADALDEAMAIKPYAHDFRIGAGLAPTQPRHMSVTGG